MRRMAGAPVKAHQINALSSARSSDGEFGLIRFVREKPLDDGTKDLWVAVPNNLLPYLATAAVQVMPRPAGDAFPNLLRVKSLGLGASPDGEVAVSLTIAKNATLSYQLDPAQAQKLLTALEKALGRRNGAAAARKKN
jgi:hypothetical protein